MQFEKQSGHAHNKPKDVRITHILFTPRGHFSSCSISTKSKTLCSRATLTCHIIYTRGCVVKWKVDDPDLRCTYCGWLDRPCSSDGLTDSTVPLGPEILAQSWVPCLKGRCTALASIR